MDVVDIIVAVLVLAGSAVVEVAKRKRGRTEKPVREILQDPESEFMEWFPELESDDPELMPEPESVRDNHQFGSPVQDVVFVEEPVKKESPSLKRTSPAVVEEKIEADKERIDARKLVICSEIMKTKF